MLGEHLLNHGNRQGSEAPKPSQRAFTDEPSAAKSKPFVFWTPNNTGSATCKSDTPTRYFPGKTAVQSNAAWPNKHQPRSLECWNKGADGLRACWYTKILFSTDRGWPGKCQGLMDVNDLQGLSCEESCIRNPSCPVWQEYWDSMGKLVCAQGRGRDCPGLRSDTKINVKNAHRIQHGAIRVLMSLKGFEVKNLRQDFPADYYRRRSDATEACKYLCYSDVQCTYWLYSTADGCWVEDPPMHKVPYPLTQSDVVQNGDFAGHVVEGEYILHRCPENDGTYTSMDEHAEFNLLPWKWNWSASQMPWDEGGWSWITWVCFTVFTLCCCGCCFLFCTVCGVCRVIKNRLIAGDKNDKSNKKRRKSGSDSDSDSSSSSGSSESTPRGHHGGGSKQQLLQSQHFNAVAQGHGQQATHALHSSGGALHGNRPGYGGAQLHG